MSKGAGGCPPEELDGVGLCWNVIDKAGMTQLNLVHRHSSGD